MLISPLNFREFDSASNSKEVRQKPFATKPKEEIVEAPPPPPTFSEEELKSAQRDGYQRGFLEGTKEGHSQAQNEHADVEKLLLQGLDNFVNSINPIFEQYRKHCMELKQNMPVLALSIAKKVAGDALNNDTHTVLENAARQCAETMISEPQVTVTINSRLAPALQDKLKHLAMREKNASSIVVIPDDNIALSDYRIEWKNGSIERSTEKLWQHMDKAIANMLATIANEKQEQLELLNGQQTQEGMTNG